MRIILKYLITDKVKHGVYNKLICVLDSIMFPDFLSRLFRASDCSGGKRNCALRLYKNLLRLYYNNLPSI